MSLHSSFPSPDDSRSSLIIASLCGVFSHSCPPLPCLLSSSFSLQLLPFMFPPSFQFAPILSPSIPLWTLRPQISSVPGEKKQRGWEKGKKGGVGDRSWMEELQKHAGLQRWADGQNESQKVALKISQLKTTSAAAYLESMNWSFCTHTSEISNPNPNPWKLIAPDQTERKHRYTLVNQKRYSSSSLLTPAQLALSTYK